MQRENLSIRKSELRKHFLSLRKEISTERRAVASATLLEKFKNLGSALSFFSMGTEVDLLPLNEALARKNCLYLPRLEGDLLVPYRVEDLWANLIKSTNGFWEPNPSLCPKAAFSEIETILVPGLAFDAELFRLGLGKGHYDRLLSSTKTILSIGVGFQEQMSAELLPRDIWDIPLRQLALC